MRIVQGTGSWLTLGPVLFCDAHAAIMEPLDGAVVVVTGYHLAKADALAGAIPEDKEGGPSVKSNVVSATAHGS